MFKQPFEVFVVMRIQREYRLSFKKVSENIKNDNKDRDRAGSLLRPEKDKMDPIMID